MNQPEIGKKIADLRKQKGLTQEELVEKCNINVRTIQRIESGVVNPRPSTIRIILEALDYNFDSSTENHYSNFHEGISTMGFDPLLLNKDSLKSKSSIIGNLRIAWIAGIIWFALGFLENGLEYFRTIKSFSSGGIALYILVKLIMFVLFIMFQRGFIILGEIYNNYILKIISYIMIFTVFILMGIQIASFYYLPLDSEYMHGAAGVTFGLLSIVFGASLWRLKSHIGDVATLAGIFEILGGFFLITLILWFVGLILLVPANLLEVIILYKAYEIFRRSSV